MKKLLILLFFVVVTGPLWAQTGLEPGKSYLVADFNEQSLESMLELCHQAGFEYLLQRSPFATFGHYRWNPDFAHGDKAVARMAQKAEEAGVHLGLLVQPDAISENDPYLSWEYRKQLLREGRVELFDAIDANDVDLALRRNDVIKGVSTLNLLLIDDELVSYGTMEIAGDLILLHRCTRGMYGTAIVPHGVDAEVYKLWDSPGRFVAPEGALLDSVRANLERRIAASGVAFVIRSGDPGQTLIEESVRVSHAERWSDDAEARQGGTLGWFAIRCHDKKRAATTMDEVEWLMSKSAAFDAGFGLLIEEQTIRRHGGLGDMLEKIRQWDELRLSGAFTEGQKALLRDPYLDWHLEPDGKLYALNFSRRYRCNFVEEEEGVLKAESWTWRSAADDGFGLRLQVDGTTEVRNPMVNTERGLLMFPCTVKPGQRIVYDFGEKAYLTDADYNLIEVLWLEGVAALPEGASEVRLLIEADAAAPRPVVTLRYITLEGAPMHLVFPPH